MLDISTQLRHIMLATRGEQVRDSIVEALSLINDEQRDVDVVPTNGSDNLVTSGGVYSALQEIVATLQEEFDLIRTYRSDSAEELINNVMGAYY